jgi:hypothetical protein
LEVSITEASDKLEAFVMAKEGDSIHGVSNFRFKSGHESTANLLQFPENAVCAK